MGEVKHMGAAAPGVGVWCPLQSQQLLQWLLPPATGSLGAGLVRNGTSLVV